MAETIYLVEATPRNPGAGVVTVRMSSKRSHARDVIKNSLEWKPALETAPVQTIKLLGEDHLPGILEIDHGSLGIVFSPDLGNDVWSQYQWDGAALSVWRGESGDAFGAFTKVFTGRCGPLERPSADVGALPLRGAEADLDKDLLTATYAGTGAAEGDLALKGTYKPWMSGPCEGVAGVLVSKVYWVWQLHGYGAIDAVTAAYEGGLTLGASSGDHANYAALIAAVIPDGGWATCLALGLVRLKNEPSKPIVFDARGAKDGGTYVSKVGAIATHLIKQAGVSGGSISATSASNLDAAFPHDWNFYTATQTSVGDVVRKAMADIGGYAFPDENGIWRFGRYKAIKAASPLTSRRTALPLVQTVSQKGAMSPVGRVEIGARRCWTLHREDDISPALLDALDKVDGIEDGATKTAAGQMLRDITFALSDWSTDTAWNIEGGSWVGTNWAHATAVVDTSFTNVNNISIYRPGETLEQYGVKVVQGARLFQQWKAVGYTPPATRSVRVTFWYYNVSGTLISVDQPETGLVNSSTVPANTTVLVQAGSVVPTGASIVIVGLSLLAGSAATGGWAFGDPYLAYAAPGADVTRDNSAGSLIAGGKILQNGGPALLAGASPFKILVVDGDVITFTPALSVTPKESFDLSALPAVSSGESYSARAESLTGTGCTVRVKKRTSGGTVSTLSTGTGSVITTDLEYQVSKGDSRDARDGNYKMRLKGKVRGFYSAAGGGWFDQPMMIGGMTIEIFAKVSAAWQSCGVFTITPPYGVSALHDFDETFTFTCANAIGDPAGNEFRAVVTGRIFTADDKLTELTSVTWQVDGSTPTETAVTQAVVMRIQPQNV